MQRSTFIKVAAIGALAFAGSAYGQDCDKTFDGSESRSWSNGDNWTPSGVPTADDRVCIPQDLICEVDIDAVADTIQIDGNTTGDAPGKLIILTTRKLTVDNDNYVGTPEHSVIEGTLEIQGTGVLFFDENDHNVTGGSGAGNPSEIVGSNSDSSIIQIDAGTKLTINSDMTVRGRLKIQSDAANVATFINQGIVLADGDGILELADNLALEDTASADAADPRWKADGVSAELKFFKAHTTVCPALQGRLLLTGSATFNVAQSFYTLGIFTCTGTGTVSGAGDLQHSYDCDENPPTFLTASSCP